MLDSNSVVKRLIEVGEVWRRRMRFHTIKKKGLLVFLALGVFDVIILSRSLSYRFGPVSHPGPGFFPVIVGVAMLIALLWAIREHLQGKGERSASEDAVFQSASEGIIGNTPYSDKTVAGNNSNYFSTGAALKGTCVVVICFVYMALLPALGLSWTVSAIAFTVIVVNGYKRWWLSIVVAFALGIITQFLFISILYLKLPASPILL